MGIRYVSYFSLDMFPILVYNREEKFSLLKPLSIEWEELCVEHDVTKREKKVCLQRKYYMLETKTIQFAFW